MSLRPNRQAMHLRATANQLDYFLQRLEAGETLHRHDVWGAMVDAAEALRAYAKTLDEPPPPYDYKTDGRIIKTRKLLPEPNG